MNYADPIVDYLPLRLKVNPNDHLQNLCTQQPSETCEPSEAYLPGYRKLYDQQQQTQTT